MKKDRISISINPIVLAQAKERSPLCGLSAVIGRDLERLYDLYKYALNEIELSRDEACYLVDVLNGHLTSRPETARLLYAEVEDGNIYDGLGDKWKVDEKALSAKLKGYSLIQNLAIIDAAERFWAEGDRQGDIKEMVKEFFGRAIKD